MYILQNHLKWHFFSQYQKSDTNGSQYVLFLNILYFYKFRVFEENVSTNLS